MDLEKFMTLIDSSQKQPVKNSLVNELKLAAQQWCSNPDFDTGLWKTDADIVAKLEKIDFSNEQIILYYGKYLWTKGIQLIIAAAPLIMMNHHQVRFWLVGFGSSRSYFEAIIAALNQGDQAGFIKLITHPEAVDGEIDPHSARFFKALLKKLEDPDFAMAYFIAAREKIEKAFILTGFLGHNQLKSLIACADITVATSIFPEAFGLVAAEALSSGIIPVQTDHSGFSEVIKRYIDEFDDVFDRRKLKLLALDDQLVLNLASNIAVLLVYYQGMNSQERQQIRERARKISVDNYSWESVVRNYVNLCQKNTDEQRLKMLECR
ncbi:glycosyltransferase family 4 protein [Acetobacterium sp. UBA5834]|uniref:glycosyltransferase family 4 protein n=1 Tax=Acetobacterium sp. UBA5834 TaxID=1945907 RepID=UPI00257D16D0|nr:glycosyltransferase family 4 protein [Acetobacterium sp. UBA5834]